jgi:hypothetical protein
MIRRFLPLPVLLEIVDLIVNVTDTVFLDLILFAIGENYSVFFFSDLISILNFFLAFGGYRCSDRKF